MKNLFIAALLLFSTAAWSKAEVTFRANIFPDHISMDDTVTMEVVLSTEGADDRGEIKLPNFPDFTLVGQNQSSSRQIQIVNGKISQLITTTVTAALQPKKEGFLRVHPASVTVDGILYRTKAKKIRVDDKAPAPQAQRKRRGSQGQDPFAQLMQEQEEMMNQLFNRSRGQIGTAPPPPKKGKAADENFTAPRGRVFLRMVPSKKVAYKGEQIVATYYIYLLQGARVSTLEYDQLPKLNGFWKEERVLTEDTNKITWETVRVKGKVYRRGVMVQYALYPIGSGKKTVDALKMRVGVLQAGRQRGFGFNMPQTYRFPKASETVDITVLPLPKKEMPKNFLGAVGNFSIKATPLPAKLPINKAFSFKVTVSGKGNFNAIDELSFATPENLEFFDSKVDPKKKSKTFEYILIPRANGKVTFPSVPFSYFDPKSKKYVTKKTKPMTVEITGTAAATAANSNNLPGAPSPKKTSGPQKPPVYETLPPAWYAKLEPIVEPVTAGLVWFLALSTLGMRAARKRQPRKKEKVTGLSKNLKTWKSQYAKSPPGAAQIEGIRFAVLENVVAKLPENKRFKPSKNKATEAQLDQALSQGLDQNLYSQVKGVYQSLEKLAFGASNDEMRKTLWDQALTAMKDLAGKLA